MGKKLEMSEASMAITWRSELTDTQLLARVEAGDSASFEELFLRHYDRVYGLLYRLLGTRQAAEDLTQEVFLKLYSHPFHGDREHNVSAWLYSVATRAGYNTLRSEKRLWQRNTLLVPPESRPEDNPAHQVEHQEQIAAVRRALGRLKPEQTQLLLLRQMGLSYAELAEACDLNPNSVGKLLSRAMEAFREAYEVIADS